MDSRVFGKAGPSFISGAIPAARIGRARPGSRALTGREPARARSANARSSSAPPQLPADRKLVPRALRAIPPPTGDRPSPPARRTALLRQGAPIPAASAPPPRRGPGALPRYRIPGTPRSYRWGPGSHRRGDTVSLPGHAPTESSGAAEQPARNPSEPPSASRTPAPIQVGAAGSPGPPAPREGTRDPPEPGECTPRGAFCRRGSHLPLYTRRGHSLHGAGESWKLRRAGTIARIVPAMNVLKISAAFLCAIALAVTASAAPRVQPWGLHLDYLDQAAKPGDDFYVYANGGWLKTAEIPPDRPGAGVGLEMSKANEERLKAIIDELHTRANLTAEEQKLRDLYDAFMDEGQVEANGLKPAEKDLAEIASLRTLDDVAREMALPSLRLGGPFEMFIAADDKHPDAYVVKLGQSGLGLPHRAHYLRDDNEIVSTREAYKTHLAQTLNSWAAEDAEVRAAAVYELEHQIAVVSWAAADRRDAEKVYNPMTIPKLRKLAPGYPWDTFFKWAGISPKSHGVDRTVVVGESTAFPRIAKIFADTPVPVWRDFLTIRYVHTFAPYLPRRFNDADFAFYGTVLQGRARQLDRPTRGARLLDNRVGEALGKLYVGKYFPAESKAKVRALVDNLLQAYEQDLKTLPWMTPETRQKALE